MAFTPSLVAGTNLEGESESPHQNSFCDFGSALNTWESGTRYRIWIQKTLNVMKTQYKKY